MKKNSVIGYILAIVSGLILVGSAFLSLTMISLTGNLEQQNSLFDYFFGGAEHTGTMSVVVILYAIGIILAVLCLLCAVVGLIFALKSKFPKTLLLIVRILSLCAFVAVIIGLVLLGVYLATISAIYSNFIGLGIMLAVLGSLLLIEGTFLVRVKTVEKKD